MRQFQKFVLAIILLLVFGGCEKPPQPDEPFYCKINGQRWRPSVKTSFGGSNLTAEWNKKGRFNILAFRDIEYLSISLVVDVNGIKEGQYLFTNNNMNGRYYYDYTAEPSQREVLNSKDGSVTITKVFNHYISGTFEFTVYSDKKKKEFEITKGQFNNLYYSEL